MSSALKQLNFGLLMAFSALYRNRSVTRAAEELEISQGAMSQSLKRLRTLFDDELFIASHEGLQPTPLAEELFVQVSHLIEVGEQVLMSRTSFDPTTAEREVTLAMADVGTISTVPLLLEQLKRIAPGCSINVVDIDPEHLNRQLMDGGVDLAIGREWRMASASEIIRQKLYSQGYTVLANERSGLPSIIDLDRYCELDHLAVRMASIYHSPVDQFLEQRGKKRRIVVTIAQTSVSPYLVSQSISLVATVPNALIQMIGPVEGTMEIELSSGLPSFDIYQFWHSKFKQDPFNVWLRSVIRSSFFKHRLLHYEA